MKKKNNKKENYLAREESIKQLPDKIPELKFYKTENKKIANALIKTKKYLYFTQKEPSRKNPEEIITVFYFEFAKGLHDDVLKIKSEIFADNKKPPKKNKPSNRKVRKK